MFSNFEPLRGLEPRTHALRMRNMVLKISELEGSRKNLYRNKTKKIKHEQVSVCHVIVFDYWILDCGILNLSLRIYDWRGW